MENKETQTQTDIKDMSLILNKPYIAYVFKKTLKISQVLYLITDYFEQTEPLRISIRLNANTLSQNATSFLKNDQKDKREVSHILSATFLETLSLIQTASLINLLSDKNNKILSEEINHLLETIDSHKDRGVQLSREFIEMMTLEEHKRQSPIYKGQDTVLNIKDKNIAVFNTVNTPKNIDKRAKVVQKENKDKRLSKIITLFKAGSELMIKDITNHLKDVSEKTIQRELLLLVDQGKLKKIGKKRWSKYRLN
jgi:hypothetical protein